MSRLTHIPEVDRAVSKIAFPSFAAKMLLPSAFAVLLWSALPTQAQQPQSATPGPVGEWLVAKKVARIKIANCDNRLWGVVSWEARPGVDSQNPDARLRDRPTLGMPILLGMKPASAGKWEGEIYNSENGKTYKASISLRDENTLQVQGCVLSVLCGGENWTRFEDPDAQPTPPQKQQKQPAKKRAGEQPRGGEQMSDSDKVCASIPGAAGTAH